MGTNNPAEEFAFRAALPEVMFREDVALALQVDATAAEEAMLRGDCGPVLVLGERIAVLRESFLGALAARTIDPRNPRAVR